MVGRSGIELEIRNLSGRPVDFDRYDPMADICRRALTQAKFAPAYAEDMFAAGYTG